MVVAISVAGGYSQSQKVTYVIGGGGGYNYVGATSVTINDLEAKANYVVAAGTNGYTGTADLTVNGGEIETVKGLVEGKPDSVTQQKKKAVTQFIRDFFKTHDIRVTDDLSQSLT